MEFATLVQSFKIKSLLFGLYAFDGVVYDRFAQAYFAARDAAHSWLKANVQKEERGDYRVIGSQFGVSVYKVN